MQENRVPKIFISYSWSSDALVVPLAERLVSHGVDVVFDKWDLKEGQDKYVFMEQCVNNPDITKVLIVSDRQYAEKADTRKGGVGDETVIISPEIYGQTNQDRFIPIVAEKDENGNAYLPAYIKSRIYIDLSDDDKYELEYEKLLRNIYERPSYRKPALGKRPEWLDEENVNLFPLTDLLRQIKGSNTQKKVISNVGRFIDAYIDALKKYIIPNPNGEQVYEKYIEMKPVRDIFLDFLPVLHETDLHFSEIMSGTFERLHNTLTCAKGFNSNVVQANKDDYEIYHILIWELFVCTTAFLRHMQDYKAVHELLTYTYFLTNSCLDDSVKPTNYCKFRFHSSMIEEDYKPQTVHHNKYTLLGNILCSEREKLPIYTNDNIAESDLFLYQVTNGLDLTEDKTQWMGAIWFPVCYAYAKKSPEEWIKMKSKRYCYKMYDLFGVTTLEGLIHCIEKCVLNRDVHYNLGYFPAPAILSTIKLEDIGTIN